MKASKLKLWWWLMFNPKKFDQWIKINESILRENVTRKLEKQFEDKLEFLAIEEERDSMLASELEYPVLQIPICNHLLKPYRPSSVDRSPMQVDVFHKKELMLPISFCNERNTINDFKRLASNKLADDLIEKGLLKSRFWRSGPETVVEFYINVYQK